MGLSARARSIRNPQGRKPTGNVSRYRGKGPLVPQLHEAKTRHEAIAAALRRGHLLLATQWATGKTQARWECRLCGMEVTADWNPPANGIDVSGEAVALNCPY